MKKSFVWPVVFIIVFALSRWPGLMPQNFGAAYAVIFCAGLYLPGRMAWWLPLGMAAVTDLLLNIFFYSHQGFSLGGFLAAELPTCLAYAGLIALGRSLGAKRPWWMLVTGGFVGALLFYIVTNTAAWLTMPEYPKTLAGWIQALTTGLPGYPPTWEFFRGTFWSSGIFSGLFVGAMKLTEVSEEADEEEEAAEVAPERQPVEAESDR